MVLNCFKANSVAFERLEEICPNFGVIYATWYFWQSCVNGYFPGKDVFSGIGIGTSVLPFQIPILSHCDHFLEFRNFISIEGIGTSIGIEIRIRDKESESKRIGKSETGRTFLKMLKNGACKKAKTGYADSPPWTPTLNLESIALTPESSTLVETRGWYKNLNFY